MNFNLCKALAAGFLLITPILLNSANTAEETNENVILRVYHSPEFQTVVSRKPLQPITLRHDPSYISNLRVPPPLELELQQQRLMVQQATISINYLPAGDGKWGDVCLSWPDQPKVAFAYAANLWASQLQSSVPISIDACWVSNLPSGVLGHGGANNYFSNFSGALSADTWYAVGLANSLHGSDLDPRKSDIYIGYNNQYNWYFGTDGNTPSNQIDFVSVVLHEIAHGLGFSGSMQVSGGQGVWGLGTPYPIIYDRFTENGAGQRLIDTAFFPNPSAVLATQLTSNNIYFNGVNTNFANGGVRAPLFTPLPWSQGSSYSHLAESYNNTPNALMTYALPTGESIHSPGPVALGLLKDIGWNLHQASSSYILNLTKAGAGTGLISGGGNYAAGATVTLTATPNAGSAFAGWSPSPCAASFSMPANNLTCTATFNPISLSKPDLVVTSVTSPSSGAVGGKVSGFSAVIKNQGTADAGAFRMGIYLSTDTTITTSDIDTGWGCNVPSLAVGASWTCSGEVGIPAVVSPGKYYLGAYADSKNAVSESNESNNGRAASNQITLTRSGTPLPVYRFYNTSAGGHFFTMNEEEKNTVINNYKWFRYEGVGFKAYSFQVVGDILPVYRFYNTTAGGHFFTLNEEEKNTVINNYKWFRYEGVGFYAFPFQAVGTLPVYRFYNTSAGGHFFTMNEAERDTVINHYKWFRYEGIGFYAWPAI